MKRIKLARKKDTGEFIATEDIKMGDILVLEIPDEQVEKEHNNRLGERFCGCYDCKLARREREAPELPEYIDKDWDMGEIIEAVNKLRAYLKARE